MFNLHPIDWLIIALYVALAVGVGMAFKRRAGRSRSSYFLAGRALPWWWVGASMAATTFAADTPLAVAGIIADKGLSGNWLWIPAIGVHAAVFVLFAANWSRSGVMTDAELIRLRYSGGSAYALRWCRAGLQLMQNCVVLGWVLRAMVKVASPFFLWHEWFPGLMPGIEAVWPAGTALGNASEGMTVLVLLLVVGFYSTLGGLRGVVLTDLAQLSLALIGSTWLAVCAWKAVGGRSGLLDGLIALYGPDHAYLDWFPSLGSGWLGAVGVGAGMFGLYLVVQSFSNMSADGGGYFMQRLNAARSPDAARRATLLFLIIHYMVRVWPWFIVGLAALVLIPLGQEMGSLNGAGALAATDREMAWPVLMAYLLGPGWLGIVLTSLLAAFMSTVDTHINWGASYLVNDVWLVLRPSASDREQMRVARSAVILFVLLAIVVSARIETIAQAWKWMATLGAALGLPTLLRWVWWRVNASGEIGAMLAGLSVGTALAVFTDVPYETRLIWVAAASLTGLIAGMLLGPPTAPEKLRQFVETVQPSGVWPDARPWARRAAIRLAGSWAALVGGVLLLLYVGHQGLFVGWQPRVVIAGAVALGLLYAGTAPRPSRW
ncbi:MAG: Na+:solute symporter [Candidatus Tectomicrobia bacterium]|nr:Na+:solute symporter [Candidatus Tectomicrobia bacterium]